MQIVAVVGLAQNFAALRSLTTTGIQEGHMKMHLGNIINQLEATDEERIKIVNHFEHHPVSHAAVVEYVNDLRKVKS
jgi:hydroxymethylglutaryl-CoA reductase